MSEKLELKLDPRIISGRKVKDLRAENILPGVLYGSGLKPLNIQITQKEFKKVYSQAGESTMIYVNLGGEKYPAMIQEVVSDPVSDIYIHVDFYKVRLDKKITAKVPVVITGVSSAVRDLGGILVKNINEIEVEGFPQDIPHRLEADISGLDKFGAQVLLKDIRHDANIEIKGKPEEIIALVQEPISEEQLQKELEVTAKSAEEVEVIKKEKKEEEVVEEGETPAAAPAEAKKPEAKK